MQAQKKTQNTPESKGKNENIDIQRAVKTLQTEIDAQRILADNIDDSFVAALDVIEAMKQRGGRLIITGMGKSGHIARKISATMASTGTPSQFVHPGEASHGDLGMITQNDAVLALSNSGEAPELADIIAYTRRFSIPLIGMTSKPESSLGRHSDIKLIVPGAPEAPEACPNGLAPTTSTTLMIALGDALSVCLLERMGLSKEQYKVFHPGGKLGQRLLKISEIMTPKSDMPIVADTATMDSAILVLSEKNLGSVVVMDETFNTVMGIITDGDLKRHMSPTLLQKPVTEVMSTNPKTIASTALAAEALDVMSGQSAKHGTGQPITSLLVIDPATNTLAGMIRVQDCLRHGIA